MKLTLFHIIYAIAFQLYICESAKILAIFHMEAQSHYSYTNAIMKSLIEVGHEVTIITPFPEKATAENYSSIIDVSNQERQFISQATPMQYRIVNILKFMDVLVEAELPYCSRIIKLPEIQKILNSDKKLYDVLFVEMLSFYHCFMYLAEKMNVPVIGTTALRPWLYGDYIMHNSNHPAFIPNELVNEWKLDHIFGRILNVWNHIAIIWYKNFVISPLVEKFHRDHARQLSSFSKYMHMEPDLVFYNNYPSILPKPTNPNIIEIGGIHVKDTKPLPKHIQKFIDEAKNGVILFSLGSVVRAATLSSEKKKALRDAFAEIPQRVIWKFEEKFENLPSNVMVLDWLPQRDILEHKKVIAFISHCGMGATNEALYTATPVVAIPLFADQLTNAELLEKLGVAVHLDYDDITKETVLKALNAIVNDTRYYNGMQKVSNIFKDRPMTPQQSVVYWTEYVIRHNGAAHFKSPASRLNLFQYLLLDVVFTVLLILAVTIYLVNRIFRILYASLINTKTAKKSSKSKNKKLD